MEDQCDAFSYLHANNISGLFLGYTSIFGGIGNTDTIAKVLVVNNLKTAAHEHPSKLVIGLAIFDQHRTSRVALEVLDLLRIPIGVHMDRVIEYAEPHRYQMRPTIVIEGPHDERFFRLKVRVRFLVAQCYA